MFLDKKIMWIQPIAYILKDRKGRVAFASWKTLKPDVDLEPWIWKITYS